MAQSRDTTLGLKSHIETNRSVEGEREAINEGKKKTKNHPSTTSIFTPNPELRFLLSSSLSDNTSQRLFSIFSATRWSPHLAPKKTDNGTTPSSPIFTPRCSKLKKTWLRKENPPKNDQSLQVSTFFSAHLLEKIPSTPFLPLAFLFFRDLAAISSPPSTDCRPPLLQAAADTSAPPGQPSVP